MLEIIFLVLFIYTNGKLAERKGKNVLAWRFLTFLAVFSFEMIASGIVISRSYHGPMEQVALVKFIYSNPFTVLVILLAGIGGGLLIRFILEKQPDHRSND